MRVVLASESQSRRRALDILGLAYEVHPSAIDEKAIRDPAPAALTKKLAEAKARKVASALQGAVAVAGDAVVAKGEGSLKNREATMKPPNSCGNFPAAFSIS